MSKTTTDSTTAFTEAYGRLNTKQREAVDTIEGPVLVVAGPGTGKTQILTLRIANILRLTDTQPEQILALTFTESGAKAMRERLHQYIGAAAYRVPIYTFHGFAGQLIAKYPDTYQSIVGGRPASELDKIRIFETILDNPELTAVRPPKSPYHNLKAIRNTISKLKQEYVTPDRLAKLLREEEAAVADIEQFHTKGAHKGKERGEYKDAVKNLAKNQELLTVYQQYEALLHEHKLFDYDDMLLETVAALKSNEDMLFDVQETYQYVLADEHQDVNGVQNTLLDTIVSYHDAPNIFAVGDEKQAIYRFQGASLENFLFFEQRYTGCKTISLTDNYRSAQPILDIAHSLIAVEDGPLADLRIPLTAATERSATLTHRAFDHQAVEDSWVVEAIVAEIDRGVPASEIAVLVRTNASVEQFAHLLRQAGVPVSASAESDILEHPITHQLSYLLRVVAHGGDSEAWFTVLQASYSGVSIADVARIMSGVSYTKPLAAIISDSSELQSLTVENRVAVEKLVAAVSLARTQNGIEPPQRVLETLLTQSGFLEYVMNESPIDGARIVRRLYDEVESLVRQGQVLSVADVVRTFAAYREYGIALNAPFINATDDAVSVMTVHKSKGLEFSSVYVPRLIDSSWGGATKAQYFKLALSSYLEDSKEAQMDDERRLLYVALTRAKEQLHLSYAETSSEGKEYSPTRLFDELALSLLTQKETDTMAAAFNPAEQLQNARAILKPDREFLASLFMQKGFSATSLNNYLSSPYNYLYRNLLLVPQVQNFSLQYGTVVHNVLERSAKQYFDTQERPSDTQIKTWIEVELSRLPLSDTEYTSMHERAFGAVLLYLDATLPRWSTTGRTELKLEVDLETGIAACPTIRLTGKLDRLDMAEDGTVVRVVDYKTGSPKSRNEIEGKTKNANGNYKRQLVFYALLLELYDKSDFKTRDMLLSFVEATNSGVIKEELFTITDQEIEALKAEIIAATQAITDGSWLDEPCDSSTSDYCALRSF